MKNFINSYLKTIYESAENTLITIEAAGTTYEANTIEDAKGLLKKTITQIFNEANKSQNWNIDVLPFELALHSLLNECFDNLDTQEPKKVKIIITEKGGYVKFIQQGNMEETTVDFMAHIKEAEEYIKKEAENAKAYGFPF
jgi:hypothetical protein